MDSMINRLKNLALVFALIASSSALAEDKSAPLSLFEVVKQSKKCGDGARAFTTDCIYKAGKDLEILLHGLGEEFAVAVINRSKYEGDFHAEFGLMWNTCVMVRPGRANSTYKIDDAKNWIYISMKNGNVYRDFTACSDAK